MGWLDQILAATASQPSGGGGTPAWNTANNARTRQQAVVDALRMAATQKVPTGQVIGGGGGGDIFGARPGIYAGGANWGTALAQGLSGLGAGYAQNNLDMGEATQEQDMKAERDRWLESMYPSAPPPPNTPPAMPAEGGVSANPTVGRSGQQAPASQGLDALPGAEAPGVLAEADAQIARNATLLKKSVAALPDPMDEHRKTMKWAAQGMDNPLTQALAKKVWESGVDFPEKRTLANERQEAISADKLRSLEAAAQRLEIQIADKSLDRAQRARLQEQRLTLQAAIANESNKIRREGHDVQRAVLPYTIGLKQRQIDSLERGKPLGDKDKEILSAVSSTATGLDSLLSKFKDDYAGWGAAGPAVRTGGNLLGSWAPQEIQDMDNWWAEFEMLAELPMRHEMFGAALTATEKQAWSNAQRVRANKDPAKVRAALEDMIRIAKSKGEKFRAALAAEGKNPESVDALLGGGERTVVRRGKRKSDGASVVEYSDGSIEVIE